MKSFLITVLTTTSIFTSTLAFAECQRTCNKERCPGLYSFCTFVVKNGRACAQCVTVFSGQNKNQTLKNNIAEEVNDILKGKIAYNN